MMRFVPQRILRGLARLLQGARLRCLPFVIRPHLGLVVNGDEHERVSGPLHIHLDEVCVEVLTPKVRFFVSVVEHGYASGTQLICDHVDISPVLTDKGQCYVVLFGSHEVWP